MNLDAKQLTELGSLMQRLGILMRRTSPTCLTSEGEHGEVKIIRSFLPPGQATYVDIGAADPIECSNTWAFYQEGWHGLLIEPLPTYWYKLLRMRPRDRLVPIAMSNVAGYSRLRACESCSSIRPDWSIREHAELMVETDTLANILSDYPDIRDRCQLCSIDVEGFEPEVLQGIDWETFRPSVFVVEYRKFEETGEGADLSSKWEPILQANRYSRVGETSLNYIYATTEAIDKRKAEAKH